MNAKLLFFSLFFLLISFVANAQWQTSGRNLYYNTGNVGIGTSTPAVELEVIGTTETNNLTLNGKLGRHLTASDQRFTYNGQTIPSYSLFWQAENNSQSGHILWLSSYAGMKLFTGNLPRLTITRTGNVGIGTSTPAVELEVIGTTETNNLTLNGKLGRHLTASDQRFTYNGQTIPSYSLFWQAENNSQSGHILWLSSYAGMKLFTGNLPRLTITGAGNVGIGTVYPQYKLSVEGTIQAKEVKVNSHEWADFVFEDDYVLSSLEDVESYIKTNKHLPGIPSAEEVKENGIGLAEINVKLLQKVEEQTLYILELNRKIQEIEAKLEKLQ